MKLAMKHYSTPALVLAFIATMQGTAHAGIKPVEQVKEAGLTDFKPPDLHSNQGGRSHGGGIGLIHSSLYPIMLKPGVGSDTHPYPVAGGSLIWHVTGTLDTHIPEDIGRTTGYNPLLTMAGEFEAPVMISFKPRNTSTRQGGHVVPAPGALTLLLAAGLAGTRRRRD